MPMALRATRPVSAWCRGLPDDARLVTAGHRATDRAGQKDVVAVPARPDQIDPWIAEGLLAGRVVEWW